MVRSKTPAHGSLRGGKARVRLGGRWTRRTELGSLPIVPSLKAKSAASGPLFSFRSTICVGLHNFVSRWSPKFLLYAFGMERHVLKILLKEAEQRMFEGAWRIARQKELIVEASSRGIDVGPYRTMLATFEDTLHLHIQHVHRIKENYTCLTFRRAPSTEGECAHS